MSYANSRRVRSWHETTPPRLDRPDRRHLPRRSARLLERRRQEQGRQGGQQGREGRQGSQEEGREGQEGRRRPVVGLPASLGRRWTPPPPWSLSTCSGRSTTRITGAAATTPA